MKKGKVGGTRGGKKSEKKRAGGTRRGLDMLDGHV